MKKILFLFIYLSLGFVSCSSDDEKESPYLKIEKEPIIIPYYQLATTIKIDTNEKWTIENSSDWGELDKISGEGKASIGFTCWSNDSYKNNETILTIKTKSFTKEVSITQEGDNRFQLGDFAVCKNNSKIYYTQYLDGKYANSGEIKPYWGEQKNTMLTYKGDSNNKSVFSLFIEKSGSTSYLTIITDENTNGNKTREDGWKLLEAPYYISVTGNPYSGIPTLTNIKKDNLEITQNDNTTIYTFKDYKIGNHIGWSYLLNGTLYFELEQ